MSATTEQRQSNLQRAETVRLARAALCSRIKQMDRTDAVLFQADLLLDLPDCLKSMAAWKFMRLPNHLYRYHWTRWLASAWVSEARPLGMLTPRQRGRLASCMRAYVEGSGKTR